VKVRKALEMPLRKINRKEIIFFCLHFRLVEQLKEEKSDMRRSYDDMKRELNNIRQDFDQENARLTRKVKELEIELSGERKKTEKLHEVK
jgi:hypothetical protein